MNEQSNRDYQRKYRARRRRSEGVLAYAETSELRKIYAGYKLGQITSDTFLGSIDNLIKKQPNEDYIANGDKIRLIGGY